MSIVRGPQRVSLLRSRPNAVSTDWARLSSACGASVVATAMAQLTNAGWSVTPQGGVQ